MRRPVLATLACTAVTGISLPAFGYTPRLMAS